MFFSFGDINIDLVWSLEDNFQTHRTSFPYYGNLQIQIGGVAYNLARFSRELGEEVCVIGKIGNDIFGKYMVEEFNRQGISTQYLLISEDNNSCLMNIFPESFWGEDSKRHMLYNVPNSNSSLSVDDLEELRSEICFSSDDIFLSTGYSFFRDLDLRNALILLSQKAALGGAKIVFDLTPHDLSEVEINGSITDLIIDSFGSGKIDLCVGELRTWEYILGSEVADSDISQEHLEEIAKLAKDISDFICIRYGYENCSLESLLYQGRLLFTRSTGYPSIEKDKIGFSEKLTVSLAQQIFAGRHSWLDSAQENFTLPLSPILDFMSNSPPDVNILDIGCGYGRTFPYLKQEGFCNLFGLDTSKMMIDRAERENPDVHFFHCAIENLPKNLKFRFCLLVGVLTTMQNAVDIESLVDRIVGILDQDGILLVSDFLLNRAPDYVRKYEVGVDIFGEEKYGVFLSKNGAINRHFRKEFIQKIIGEKLNMVDFAEIPVTTINGNLTTGFWAAFKKRV